MLRISEVARRTGVTAEVLRAWERRYGLLEPERTSGGFRLYSEDDVQRVRRMRDLLESGLSAAEAARAAVVETVAVEASAAPGEAAVRLIDALTAYDDGAAHALLDEILARYTLDTVLADVVLPAARELGDRWERGEAGIAEEHFASSVLRGRLLALTRGWDRGTGPRALLATWPDERHELGLIAFGLALRSWGWRIAYLGPDTPLETIARAAEQVRPAVVVMSATLPRTDDLDGLRRIAAVAPLAVGGAGIGPELAEAAGALLLPADVVAAAAVVAAR
jgi:DNA-binding transcriptional MerR regulator